MDRQIWTLVGLLGLVVGLAWLAGERDKSEDTCGEGHE